MSRCWALVGLLCAGALALAGCDEQPPLRVGFLAELTGRSSDLAEAGRNGVLMSIELARDSKLLKGRRVDVLIRDTEHRRSIWKPASCCRRKAPTLRRVPRRSSLPCRRRSS